MSNKLFENIKSEGLEKSEDRLGGFSILETDIYSGIVKAFYAGKSDGGAMNVTLILDIGGGKEYREEIYITNKKGENFFTKDGKKMPLPGFTTVNDICLVTTEKELHELETEEKIIKVYDYDAKKEVPTAVQMVTEVLGKPLALGIQKVREFKQKKNAQGVYEDTDETREVNTIQKVFHPTAKVTVPEAREGKTTGEFWDKWLTKNKGQVYDKTKGKGGSGDSSKPAPAAGSTPPASKPSLFKK